MSLADAIESQDRTAIKEILKKDPYGELGALGLNIALESKDTEMVKFIKQYTRDKQNTLHRAIKNGYIKVIDYELSRGLAIGRAADIAATVGNREVIKHLEGVLHKYYVPKDFYLFYDEVLDGALSANDLGLVKYAIKNGATIVESDIYIAIDTLRPKMLEYLLYKSGIKPDSNMIYKAIGSFSPQMVLILLENGARPVKQHLDRAISLGNHMYNNGEETKEIDEIIRLLKTNKLEKL